MALVVVAVRALGRGRIIGQPQVGDPVTKSRVRGLFALLAAVLATQALPMATVTVSLARSQIAPDAFEPDDSPATARELELNGVPQQHTIHVPGDRDWVRFSVQGGARVRLFTRGELCDTVLTLFTSNGAIALVEDDDSGGGGNASMEVVLGESGTYHARVRAYADTATCEAYELLGALPGVPISDSPGPGASPPGPGTGSPTPGAAPPAAGPPGADPYEPDDTPEQATPLPLDGTEQARTFHATSDVDWVSLPLDPRDVLFIFTSGPCDTALTLYGPDARTILAEDDDLGDANNAAIFYRATTSDTYYVRVRVFPGPMPCAYQLTGFRVPGARPSPTLTPTVVPSAPIPGIPTTAAGTPTPRPPVVLRAEQDAAGRP